VIGILPGAGALAMQLPKDLAGHRFRIADSVVKSRWLQEFARQIAEEAWAEGEAAGWDNCAAVTHGVADTDLKTNPHTNEDA